MDKKRKSVAVDMDGVIADTAEQFLNWYEMKHGVRIPRERLHGVSELDALPNQAARKFVFEQGFFRGVPVMEGAKEAVQELMKYFDVYIVSAAMEFKHSLYDKYEWLDEHFPFIPWKRRIFCGNKHLIKGDVLIDDHDFNLSVFTGKPIVFTAPHNVHYTEYERMDSWLDAKKFFEG